MHLHWAPRGQVQSPPHGVATGHLPPTRGQYQSVDDPPANGGCTHTAHSRQRSLHGEPRLFDIGAVDCCDSDPPFSPTQVQNIPHSGSRGPMTGTKELKSRCEDRKDNSSCVFLFICVSKNKMLDSRFKNWANLFNCLVNSMEDHIIRVPTGINSAAFFSQHRLPILKRRGTAKGCSGETRDPLRDENLHLYQIILE